MKKNMIALAIGVLLFFGIVCLGTMIVPHDAGMFFVITLLFVANPIYFIFTGIAAGKKPIKSWFVPLIAVMIFTGAYAIVLDMKEWIYPLVYFLLAYVAMMTTWIVKKTRKQEN